MARLGIDFGTTNTVVMIEDRDVLSEVLHVAETGAGRIAQVIFPSAILVDRSTGECWFGIEADRRFGQLGPTDDHVFVPSLKRCLRDYVERPSAIEDANSNDNGPADLDTADLLRGFLAALAESIRRSQSMPADEPLEAVITWPANANGAQRHITRKSFQEAGFEVIDTLNEPTASALEMADCLTAGRAENATDAPSYVAVFDLGGGTFDASVVRIADGNYHVLASAGIETLGGDDFDALLLEMFLDKLDQPSTDLTPVTRQALLRQARVQKETLSTGAVKSLFFNPADFGLPGRTVAIQVEQFTDQVRPLIKTAVDALGRLIEQAAAVDEAIADAAPLTLYLVGGSSKLPIVSELIVEAFPTTRVVLSDKPFRSVAMGAAICATRPVAFRDVFARHFGLMRPWENGQTEAFDTIFPAGTPLPRKGEPPIVRVARYHPRHNIGHLRYLECAAIGPDGLPSTGIRPWSDILFPYDPSLSLGDGEQIVETDAFSHGAVEEVYQCDSDGVITVELHHSDRDTVTTYEVYRD